jgi:hypothetical protein
MSSHRTARAEDDHLDVLVAWLTLLFGSPGEVDRDGEERGAARECRLERDTRRCIVLRIRQCRLAAGDVPAVGEVNGLRKLN